MLSAAVAVLACLCVARCSPAEPYSLRAYKQNPKDIISILSSIEERLRVIDTISLAQAKQSRRLDIIQDKLDRVENTLSLKLERAQLAAERLEHRLHMLQTNVQTYMYNIGHYGFYTIDCAGPSASHCVPGGLRSYRHGVARRVCSQLHEMSIKESSEKLERSQMKIAELTRNLTGHIIAHKHLLDKANSAYADTWHRSLVLESLMRDGLSLVNATRRELADGLRALARRQRDTRINSIDIETMFTKQLNANTAKIDLKMQELLNVQKNFIDSCQQVQQDDPKPVADVLEKLIESLIKMKSSTFHELHKIQDNINMHDNRVVKMLNAQTDATCRRLETAFRNTSHTILKETELRQLTEKFVSLTDRADAALQRLEAQMKGEPEEPLPDSEVTAEADRLLQKLEGYDREPESESKEYYDLEGEDAGYFDDDGGDDIMGEDKVILGGSAAKKKPRTTTVRPPHRRHLHKHPYDRGPTIKNPSLS